MEEEKKRQSVAVYDSSGNYRSFREILADVAENENRKEKKEKNNATI